MSTVNYKLLPPDSGSRLDFLQNRLLWNESAIASTAQPEDILSLLTALDANWQYPLDSIALTQRFIG
jgi:hypothetical protein